MSEAIPITPLELAAYAVLGYLAVKYVPRIVKHAYEHIKPPVTTFLPVPRMETKKRITLENLVQEGF
ncbi:MAG: hypothetical protein OH319_03335 [Candidatus Parvarchaeota archaeon]|nr:hypothetical protein [Candidatus Jingweiarchaeum tengchongense]MCW1298528.1 hypothetical protein [Candidatus Jingweiarchaeum tengchongense]MCW1300226.1 hypothetical protein [Candidatus Jingweiarchaeum tengchongense]MCW1304540.1 hypothetical protein [Candidatus Jingweiarchaeum tengchongense]MCW1305732.1 hypothetical protein [Candidatus Jingweiarchaeum tengchongense]